MDSVDNEVKFDIPYYYIRLRPGEKVVDRLDSIEDTKGNGGDVGQMVITNLRIIWQLILSRSINLSIGYNCIVTTSTTLVNSHLKGKTEALHVLTNYNNSKYEFIFTNLITGNIRHFTSVMGVHKAYILSKPYRELKLRGSIIQNKQLKMLPSEQVFSHITNVWNLSSDQGNLGTLIVTNIRIVWFADINEYFNISLPYLQIVSIKVQQSKFGLTLIIVSSDRSGGYVLGFRLGDETKLESLYKEITTLHSVIQTSPIFGVNYIWSKTDRFEDRTKAELESFETSDDVIEDNKNDITNILTVYAIDSDPAASSARHEPKYCPYLGLSIENNFTNNERITPKKLWEIIPSN